MTKGLCDDCGDYSQNIEQFDDQSQDVDTGELIIGYKDKWHMCPKCIERECIAEDHMYQELAEERDALRREQMQEL